VASDQRKQEKHADCNSERDSDADDGQQTCTQATTSYGDAHISASAPPAYAVYFQHFEFKRGSNKFCRVNIC